MNIAYALPEVNSEIDKIKRQIENQVLTAIHSGGLGPEDALNRWMEWSAAHRLGQRLNGKVKMEEGEKK